MALRDLWTLATAKPAAPTKERGRSGGASWGGVRAFGTETDVNAAWLPPARYATVQKMRAFPDTNAAMDAIILALLSRDLEVTPGSEDAQDVEIAEFIANDLHNMSSASLFDLRFEALDSALWNGCAPYQTVYGYGDDGKYHLRKLAFRPPSTITRWPVDEHGGPAGIVQADDMGRDVEFTMDELLVFVHRRTGGDLAGNPLSRRMFAPWYVLDKYYKLAPAVYERNGMAIPWARGVNDDATENARLESMLMGLRGGGLSYLRLNGDMTKDDFGLLSPTGAMLDPMPMMDYLRRAIFLSTFTQGQVLGSDGVGSLALGETHLSMLMVMLKAIGQMETDTYNRYLIPRWVGYNWAGVDERRYPRVTAREPDVKDVAAFFSSLVQGTQAGVEWDRELVRRRAHEELGVELPDEETKKKPKKRLNAGEDVEPTLLNGIQIQAALDIMERVKAGILTKDQAMTALMGFLAIPPATADRLMNPVDGTDPGIAPTAPVLPGVTPRPAPPAVPPMPALSGTAAARELRSQIALSALGIAPNFGRMASAYEQAEAKIVAAVSGIQKQQISNLLAQAREIVAKANPDLVATTDVRFVPELSAKLTAVLNDLYEDGQREMVDELQQQDVKAPPVDDERETASRAMIAAMAVVTAKMLADRLARAWSSETLRQIRGGQFDKDVMGALLGGLGDRAVLDAARNDTTVAVAEGRKAVGDAAAGMIDHYVVSAVLDANTCGQCEELDGSDVDPADVQQYAPNAVCEGRDRCRCVLVPVAAKE